MNQKKSNRGWKQTSIPIPLKKEFSSKTFPCYFKSWQETMSLSKTKLRQKWCLNQHMQFTIEFLSVKLKQYFFWKGLFGVGHSSRKMNIRRLLHSKELPQLIRAILTVKHAIFSLVSFDDSQPWKSMVLQVFRWAKSKVISVL